MALNVIGPFACCDYSTDFIHTERLWRVSPSGKTTTENPYRQKQGDGDRKQKENHCCNLQSMNTHFFSL